LLAASIGFFAFCASLPFTQIGNYLASAQEGSATALGEEGGAYDPTLPIFLDAATGTYWYHGLATKVRRGRDGDFVLPTVEEMGLAAED